MTEIREPKYGNSKKPFFSSTSGWGKYQKKKKCYNGLTIYLFYPSLIHSFFHLVKSSLAKPSHSLLLLYIYIYTLKKYIFNHLNFYFYNFILIKNKQNIYYCHFILLLSMAYKYIYKYTQCPFTEWNYKTNSLT